MPPFEHHEAVPCPLYTLLTTGGNNPEPTEPTCTCTTEGDQVTIDKDCPEHGAKDA